MGVTATRGALTYAQVVIAETIIKHAAQRGWVLHHGDCIGGDATLHGLAVHYGMPVVIHPPEKSEYRAWCRGDETKEERPYLTRNLDIVEATQVLAGFPANREGRRSGGTWFTILAATSLSRPVVIVYPDGLIEERNMDKVGFASPPPWDPGPQA